jgi:hypothetical protein
MLTRKVGHNVTAGIEFYKSKREKFVRLKLLGKIILFALDGLLHSLTPQQLR